MLPRQICCQLGADFSCLINNACETLSNISYLFGTDQYSVLSPFRNMRAISMDFCCLIVDMFFNKL